MSNNIHLRPESIPDRLELDRLEDEYFRRMKEKIVNDRLNIGGGIFSAPIPPPVPTFSSSFADSNALLRMLAMRMRWPEGQKVTDFMTAHKHAEEKVYVFIVHNGEAITLEDEWPMYPSDSLVTKLRLLLG